MKNNYGMRHWGIRLNRGSAVALGWLGVKANGERIVVVPEGGLES